MVVYVQSRGLTQEHDYRWLRVNAKDQTPEIPIVLNETFFPSNIKIGELIDHQKESIVLARRSNDLLLLITGLKAKQDRVDFAGRSVRNSLLWIKTKNDSNEKQVRSILLQALKGQLEAKLDDAVRVGGEYGFEVDYSKLKEIGNFTSETLQSHQNASDLLKVGQNSVELREELALELISNCLPERQGLLVVVTSLKKEADLKRIQVWRSLSSRVEFNEWQEFRPSAINPTSQKKTKLILSIIAISIIVATAIALFLIVQTPPPIQPIPDEEEISETAILLLPFLNKLIGIMS
ncbi:MAG: hypothetical protein SAJ12_09670 [Jaaginema sp. PMC 1079.18]|nr:hypothetical protein [Jaaginema sp. PMC 1080.18]MEC4851268.1 hypothetical protein [Jaaginema sp. PMC 1079.18]MEC4868031.1 hypothetical protein [Jaaginema sp. PMC 1078.18]